jgi:hypothetical protein
MLYVRVAVAVRLRRRYRGDSWLGDAGGSGGPVAHRVSAHIHLCRVTLSRGFGHVETRVRRACRVSVCIRACDRSGHAIGHTRNAVQDQRGPGGYCINSRYGCVGSLRTDSRRACRYHAGDSETLTPASWSSRPRGAPHPSDLVGLPVDELRHRVRPVGGWHPQRRHSRAR